MSRDLRSFMNLYFCFFSFFFCSLSLGINLKFTLIWLWRDSRQKCWSWFGHWGIWTSHRCSFWGGTLLGWCLNSDWTLVFWLEPWGFPWVIYDFPWALLESLRIFLWGLIRLVRACSIVLCRPWSAVWSVSTWTCGWLPIFGRTPWAVSWTRTYFCVPGPSSFDSCRCSTGAQVRLWSPKTN